MMQTKELYRLYSESIRNYLTKFVGESEASDLTQEVFMKVEKNLDNFKGNASLKTWIYRIAANTAKDYLKSSSYQSSRKIKPILVEDLEKLDNQNRGKDSPESKVILDEMNSCILEFIHRLPYTYSSILVLSDLEGNTLKEIAEMLEIKLSTVKVRIHRARAMLKIELEAGCVISSNRENMMECERKEA